jgi:putative Holliday junction resolvase
MRFLALDVGDRRVGVAVSDESGLIASPLLVIRRVSKLEDFARIAGLIEQQGAEGLVVGLPLNADGTLTAQAARIKRYATALQEALRAEQLEPSIVFWDERMSTREAQQAMISSGRRAKDRRANIDAVAAAVILQDYLDVRGGRDTARP